MAEISGFFPDVNGDREYTTDFLALWIAAIIGNGVYDGDLAVAAGSNMQIIVPTGRAWINGYHYRNDGNLTLPIDNADGVLNRKDTVVLRWNINVRSITAQVLKGTPASAVTAPTITRSVEQFDLKLAEISIPAGTTAITQALITDTRLDNSVCGIVTGVVHQVDTTKLYNQIQSDLANFKSGSESDFSTWSTQQKSSFQTWADGIKGILGPDEAANLLNLINTHKADKNNPHGVTAAQVGLGNVNNTPDANKSVAYASSAGHATTADSAPANGGLSADTTHISSALTVTNTEPSGTLEVGKLWGVY